ncbi:MAG: zinc-ribbon domain-containing protein [Lachnospiraceae bacterium]
MSKKCVKCGHPLPEDASFCPHCTAIQVEKRRSGRRGGGKEGFCDWSCTGVSGRCGLCFFFVP